MNETPGDDAATKVGYAVLAVNSGDTPYGTAVFSFKQKALRASTALRRNNSLGLSGSLWLVGGRFLPPTTMGGCGCPLWAGSKTFLADETTFLEAYYELGRKVIGD